MGDRLPRKLAAILYADVADYSRLTGEDEDATHHVLRAHLDFISSEIENHSGRVVHYAGDAVLADFNTVLDALHCATAIQGELETRNADVPDGRKLQFRIGVNLGDVIVDQHEIYGDGVNVAARLESLAEPGGICISEAVRTAVGNKLPLEYDDMGEQRVKNIERSVHAYRSRLKPGSELPVSKERPTTPSPPRITGRNRLVTAATTVILISITAVIFWLSPWEPDVQLSLEEKEDAQSWSKILVPLDQAEPPSSEENLKSLSSSETEESVMQTKPLSSERKEDTQSLDETPALVQRDGRAAADKFLSEVEIRKLLIGNTINFRSPLNGQNMLVYFADDGSVAVKAEYNPNLIVVHKWFFKEGDIFCRTVRVERRNHCTRIVAGADANTLNFLNAKKGVFYTATVLEGRQLP